MLLTIDAGCSRARVEEERRWKTPMAPSTANPPSLPRGTRAWGLACAFLLNGALWLGAILAVRAVLQLVH